MHIFDSEQASHVGAVSNGGKIRHTYTQSRCGSSSRCMDRTDRTDRRDRMDRRDSSSYVWVS